MTREQQNWVWITREASYLDADGNEAERLDPASGLGGEGSWWTCQSDTKTGDLVLLYRTAPQSDIAYLFEAASDARRLGSQADHGVVTARRFEELVEDALAKEAADGADPFVRQAKEQYDDALARRAEVYEALRRYEWKIDALEQARANHEREEADLVTRERQEGLAAVQGEWDHWSDADDAFELAEAHAEFPDSLANAREGLAWEVFDVLDMPADTILETETGFKGRWVCSWEPRYKFTSPVQLSDLQAEGWFTENWNALRANFKGSYFRFDPEVWERVIDLAAPSNPGLLDAVQEYSKPGPSSDIVYEHQVRDALAQQPGALGLGDLDVYRDPEQPDRVGVEYPCPDVGFIDLLLTDADGNLTVVELKTKRAGEAVIGQVAKYMGWVATNLAEGRRVPGVVVSDGYDAKYEAAASQLDLTHIEVSDVKNALGL